MEVFIKLMESSKKPFKVGYILTRSSGILLNLIKVAIKYN